MLGGEFWINLIKTESRRRMRPRASERAREPFAPSAWLCLAPSADCLAAERAPSDSKGARMDPMGRALVGCRHRAKNTRSYYKCQVGRRAARQLLIIVPSFRRRVARCGPSRAPRQFKRIQRGYSNNQETLSSRPRLSPRSTSQHKSSSNLPTRT